jgi:hypothetical protein
VCGRKWLLPRELSSERWKFAFLRLGAVAGIVVSSALWCASCWAETELHYTPNTKADLARFITPQKFTDAFRCGDHATYRSQTATCEITCTWYCKQVCTSVEEGAERNGFYIESCSDSEVSLYSDTGLSFRISAAQFDDAGSTWLSALVAGLFQFIQPDGIITIEHLFPTTYKMAEGTPREKIIPVVRVSGTYKPQAKGDNVQVEFLLARNAPGVAQVVSFKLGTSFDDHDSFFKLEDAPDEVLSRIH